MSDVVIIVIAVLLGAFVKGVTGSGLPVVAIPVMATFIGVQEAVVIMVVPGILSNVLLIRDNLGHLAETRHLSTMVVSGVVGVAVGTYVLTTVDDEVMSLILAGVIGIYLLLNVLHPSFSIQGAVARLTAAPVGFLGGVLQGGTGVSSPLLSPYLHAYRMPRSAYVVSLTTLFLVFAIIQMGALTVAGLYTLERLALGFAVLVPMALGLVAGMRYGRTMSARAFNIWVLAVLAATAVKLLVDALT